MPKWINGKEHHMDVIEKYTYPDSVTYQWTNKKNISHDERPSWSPNLRMGGHIHQSEHDRPVPIKYHTDRAYGILLKKLNYLGDLLEIGSDRGRSTGYLSSISNKITVSGSDVRFLPVFERQAERYKKYVNSQTPIEWDYNKYSILPTGKDMKFDNIKIDHVLWRSINISELQKILKPKGAVHFIGSIRECDEYEYVNANSIDLIERWNTNDGRHSNTNVVSHRINTNGETQ